MAYRSFEDLEVWQKACGLAVRIQSVLQDCKDFGLKEQMTRSAAELRTQVYIASRIRIVSDEVEKEVIGELKSLSEMLHGLIKSVKVKPQSLTFNGLLPKSLFALAKALFDKCRARSRRCQNSPPRRIRQLTSLIFHFANICWQKTP